VQKKPFRILGALIVGWMLATPSEVSAGFLIGGTLTISVDDSPIGTNFSQNVTLNPGMTTLDLGEMTLTQSLVTTGPNTQWLVLDLEATGGRLLAGNLSGFWEIGADAALAAPGGFTGVFGYWSVNGVPTNPINPFGGGFLGFVESDPVNPSISPVFGEEFGHAIATGTTVLNLPGLVFVSPYSHIAAGGMDPSAVNGFVIGLEVTNSQSVPEPSSLCLGAIGAALAGGAALGRRRTRSRPA
jgi:PEP-CTERM motif-containing protein